MPAPLSHAAETPAVPVVSCVYGTASSFMPPVLVWLEEMISATGTANAVPPLGVMLISPVYVPLGMPVVLTDTLTDALVVPLEGLADSQFPPAAAAVKA